ncbi:MAG: hypothetical protein ACO3UV_09435, partial [Pseudomonadales bacterium]
DWLGQRFGLCGGLIFSKAFKPEHNALKRVAGSPDSFPRRLAMRVKEIDSCPKVSNVTRNPLGG